MKKGTDLLALNVRARYPEATSWVFTCVHAWFAGESSHPNIIGIHLFHAMGAQLCGEAQARTPHDAARLKELAAKSSKRVARNCYDQL